MPKYTRQIVVFIDLLGFSNMLPDFEAEALANDVLGESNYHESPTLNKLLEIFQNAIMLIDNAQCIHYQFSDNICIAVGFLDDETEKPDLFIDILVLISLLMYEFSKEGYFLRGGIDAGWFLENREIAVGIPLVNAYLLESKKANFPRVLISENFLKYLNDYKEKNKLSDNALFNMDYYIMKDSDSSFINPFFYVTNFEEKDGMISFLENYSRSIRSKLDQFSNDKKILAKYEWISAEFNIFIKNFAENERYLEIRESQNFSKEELDQIMNFQI